ncbi:MAG: hypothetical protein NC177_07615 [Ruminococcus flavefaciens]|nr:hypothetical protein [Ruminococcus flavefaciens]
MKIRVIGEKKEIEEMCRRLAEMFPDMKKSKLYTAYEGGYRCYISIENSAKGGEKNEIRSIIQRQI